jgi:beta-adrenergic-receptor kinase
MEGLQDAIQDAQYMGEVCDDTPHPVIPLQLPEEEETKAFEARVRKTRPADFSFEGILGQHVGFWFFAKFMERGGDRMSVDFLSEVENYRDLTKDALRLELAKSIVAHFKGRSNVGWEQKARASRAAVAVDRSILFRHGRSHRFAALRHFEKEPKRRGMARNSLAKQSKIVSETIALGGQGRVTLAGIAGDRVDDIVQYVTSGGDKGGQAKEKGSGGVAGKYGAAASDTLRATRVPSRNNLMTAGAAMPSTLFDSLQEAVLERIREAHFEPFLKAEEYTKFVQFKTLGEKKYGEPDFAVFRKLGRGGFGAVFACKKLTTGCLYAMKVMDKQRIKNKKAQKMIMNERSVLSVLNSPFVVCMAYAFETKTDVVFVLDLMQGGDLQFHLLHEGTFGPERTVFYAGQVLLALEHLHSLNIVYRDLKPENVLLDKRGNCRVSDMGLACQVPQQGLRGRCGTRGYWAPEMLDKEKRYGLEVDWWSYGCTIYQMLFGKSPFRTDEAKALKPEDTRASIDLATLTMDVPYPKKTFDDSAIAMLSELFQRDPKKRLGSNGADEIKLSLFFSNLDWGVLENGSMEPPFVPNRDINAQSQEDIGDFERTKKTPLTPEDHKFFEQIEFTSSEAIQRELADFLQYEEDHGPIKLQSGADVGCCTLL